MAKQDDAYLQEQLENLGKRLKEVRKAKGYTNYERFAYLHNIGRAQYGKYERGADMKISTFFKIMRELEITPNEFFEEGFKFEVKATYSNSQ